MINREKGEIEVNLKDEAGNISAKIEKEKVNDLGEIKVHVKGAVYNPGLVTLDEGMRVSDAIEKAGGARADADLEAINLASILKDGQAVYIPMIGEEKVNYESDTGKININSASKEKLMELPGIGDSIAEEIISYREKNGYFTDIEEIKNVKRIGDKTYDKLKDLISIQ
jgi:competence protein ComEA